MVLGDVGPTWRLNPLRDVGLAQDLSSLKLLGMKKHPKSPGGHSYASKRNEDIHFLDVEPMAIFQFLNVQDMFAGNLGRRRFITFANLSLSHFCLVARYECCLQKHGNLCELWNLETPFLLVLTCFQCSGGGLIAIENLSKYYWLTTGVGRIRWRYEKPLVQHPSSCMSELSAFSRTSWWI